jgi:signal recognition particle subunit SRP54
MIPGMSEMLSGAGGTADDAGAKMKRLLYIFDSMTTEELDSDGKLFHQPTSGSSTPAAAAGGQAVSRSDSKAPSGTLAEGTPRKPNARVLRVARGSGTSVQEVEELLAQHKMFSEMVKKAGGKQGWCVESLYFHISFGGSEMFAFPFFFLGWRRQRRRNRAAVGEEEE